MAMREPSNDHSQSAWKVVIALAFIGLIVRVLVAFVSDNIYHPDEVFQVLEQAHRLVFGYGIVPWEYRFGTRSWMPAGFIGLILLGCKALHLDQPQNYIFVVKTYCVLCLCHSSFPVM